MRLTTFLATLLTLLLVTGLASAQPNSSDTALAEALFQDGRKLMKAKSYDEACPKFEESYRLVPKLGTLLNLAACHDEQGKTGSAWGEYTKAVTEAKAAGETARVKFAREKLDGLEERLTKIVVEVPSPVPAQEVVVGDQTIRKAAWGTPIPLDPGKHLMVVRAPGHKPSSAKSPSPRAPPPSPKPSPPSNPSLRAKRKSPPRPPRPPSPNPTKGARAARPSPAGSSAPSAWSPSASAPASG